MSGIYNIQKLEAELRPHWLFVGVTLSAVILFLVLCHLAGDQLRQNMPNALPEENRLIIRSVMYILTIIGFPLTNLIRHVQLRLNQTMPGTNTAKSRYLITIIVSMTFAETIAIFGFVMFILGDDYNTLYIFSILSVLAIFLYRPKLQEYTQIIDSLNRHEKS